MTDRDRMIASALRNVDTQDVEWLMGRLGYGGHDQFWRSVLREVDSALRSGIAGEAPSRKEG